MQTILKPNDGNVRLYHTILSKENTPHFECGGIVPLTSLVLTAKGLYIAECPSGCGTTTYIPLAGGTDAQRLHAHARLADPAHKAKTLPAAIESVLADVISQRGLPSEELGSEALLLVKGAPAAKAYPVLAALHAERKARVTRMAQRQAAHLDTEAQRADNETARIAALVDEAVSAALAARDTASASSE